jgi:uncharacterized membrane protein
MPRTALTDAGALSTRARVPSWLWIALLWAGFAATHLVLSSASLRPRLVARLGDGPFRGLYSLAVLAWFVALVWTFARHKHSGPLLWSTIGPPALAEPVSYLLMGLAFALAIAGLLPAHAAPSSMGAARPESAEVRGLLRITRHPFNAAASLFGIAHLLVNGHLGDVVFFGGFPVFAWIGSRHQDVRLSRDRPGYRAVVADSSFVPFAALVTGRQRLVLHELPWGGFLAGIALAIVVRRWHGALFGP